jgi:hypothetical protein
MRVVGREGHGGIAEYDVTLFAKNGLNVGSMFDKIRVGQARRHLVPRAAVGAALK